MLVRMAIELSNTEDDDHVLVSTDVRKAHLNGRLEDEWGFIEILTEAGGAGKLRRWLRSIRHAASTWERNHTERLESVDFLRGG